MRRHRMGFLPESCGDPQGIDPLALPPRVLVAASMQLAVMKPAQRNREAIADFPPHRALFCKLEVVGIRRGSTTRQTGLGGHKLQMMAVALPHGLADDGDGLSAGIKANRVTRQLTRLVAWNFPCRFIELAQSRSESALDGLLVFCRQLIFERKRPLSPQRQCLGIVQSCKLGK